MAKRTTKKAAKGKPKSKAGKRRAEAPGADAVLDAALRRAALDGWRSVTLADIAQEASAAEDDVRALFANKAAVLRGLLARVDTRVAASLAEDPCDGTSARDRLFDVLMRRFDALAHDRDGMVAIISAIGCDPKQAACMLPRLLCTMAKALKAAGLTSKGPCGAVRVKGLALVYGDALRAFMADDGADLAKTMAALDRGLRRAEACARFLGWARPAA